MEELTSIKGWMSIKQQKCMNFQEILISSHMKYAIADNPRDFCLFVLGINTNLRASDLTQITVGMVKDKKAGDDLELKEKKTGKESSFF